MTLPKKRLRKIAVGNFKYAWNATGNDDWISLSVTSLENEGQLLTAQFDYHHRIIEEKETYGEQKYRKLKQQFIITPYIVKQVIDYALRNGWSPNDRAPQLDLGKMDDNIDLRLNEATI